MVYSVVQFLEDMHHEGCLRNGIFALQILMHDLSNIM